MISSFRQKTFESFQRVKWDNKYAFYGVFASIRDIEEEVSELGQGRSLTSVNFWQVMEESGMQGVDCRYGLLCSEEGDPLAVFFFQIKNFNAKESINWEENGKLLSKVKQGFQKKVASLIQFRTLVLGNLCMSGPYGYLFSPSFEVGHGQIFAEAAQWTKDILAKQGLDIQAIFIKDYYQPQNITLEQGFAEFTIQPSMQLQLDENWTSFADYLMALRSKYRVRAKKARKRLEGLTRLSLNYFNISDLQLQEMYRLYKERAEQADFNIATLKSDYFHVLHECMQEKVESILYYKDGKLVGFMTCIIDNEHLDAQFTGYDEDLNKEHDIYLNLLYDVVELGIERRIQTIHFARTAMEIKSSVGAEPHELYCYLSYSSSLTQKMIPKLVGYLQPQTEWKQRHPFK